MIEVQHVSHAFGSLPVLEDVDLAVQDGMFVSLVGPSGCGKTTLLRILHGLVRPSTGRVEIDGQVVRGPAASRAMVFQDVHLLPWRRSVGNVEFGLEVQRHPRSARRHTAVDLLSRLGLDRFAAYHPHQLSGGMKQRIGLARALATAPRYLFMDEPFAALDLQSRELLQIELLRLWEQGPSRTVVFVTHSIDEAVFLSDRVLVLSARPAHVLQVLDVHLPRPRWTCDQEVRTSPAYIDYRQRLSSLLRREALVAGSR